MDSSNDESSWSDIIYAIAIVFFIIGFVVVVFPWSSGNVNLWTLMIGIDFQIISVVIILSQQIENLRKDLVKNKDSETKQKPS